MTLAFVDAVLWLLLRETLSVLQFTLFSIWNHPPSHVAWNPGRRPWQRDVRNVAKPRPNVTFFERLRVRSLPLMDGLLPQLLGLMSLQTRACWLARNVCERTTMRPTDGTIHCFCCIGLITLRENDCVFETVRTYVVSWFLHNPRKGWDKMCVWVRHRISQAWRQQQLPRCAAWLHRVHACHIVPCDKPMQVVGHWKTRNDWGLPSLDRCRVRVFRLVARSHYSVNPWIFHPGTLENSLSGSKATLFFLKPMLRFSPWYPQVSLFNTLKLVLTRLYSPMIPLRWMTDELPTKLGQAHGVVSPSEKWPVLYPAVWFQMEPQRCAGTTSSCVASHIATFSNSIKFMRTSFPVTDTLNKATSKVCIHCWSLHVTINWLALHISRGRENKTFTALRHDLTAVVFPQYN